MSWALAVALIAVAYTIYTAGNAIAAEIRRATNVLHAMDKRLEGADYWLMQIYLRLPSSKYNETEAAAASNQFEHTNAQARHAKWPTEFEAPPEPDGDEV